MARTYNILTNTFDDTEPIKYAPHDMFGFEDTNLNPEEELIDLSNLSKSPMSSTDIEQLMFKLGMPLKKASPLMSEASSTPYTPVGDTLNNIPDTSMSEYSDEKKSPLPTSIQGVLNRVRESELSTAQSSIDQMDMQDKELSNAMARRNDTNLLAGLTEAGATIGTAIATGGERSLSQMNPNYLKHIREQADQMVGDVGTKRKELDNLIARQSAMESLATAKAKADPTSDISKLYRNLAKQLTGSVPENMSAAQLDKALPFISQMAMAQDANANRIESRKEKENTKDEIRLFKLNERIAQNVNPAAPRGGLKRLTDSRYRIDAMEAFISGQDLSKLIPQQVDELAMTLDTIISGGGASVERFKHLRADTAKGTMAKIKQWMTNKPTGTGQQSFVKLMLKSADNERRIINRRIKEAQFKQLYTFKKNYKDLGPEALEEFYKNAETWTGVPAEDIQKMENDKDFNHNYMPQYDPFYKPVITSEDIVRINPDIKSPEDKKLVRVRSKYTGELQDIPFENVQKAKDRGWDEVK